MCAWIQFGDVGEAGESFDGVTGSRPFVTHAGDGLTAITSRRVLGYASEMWDRPEECPYGLYILEDAVGVFLCVGKLHLTTLFVKLSCWFVSASYFGSSPSCSLLAFFVCCCLFCYVFCFRLASLVLYSVM